MSKRKPLDKEQARQRRNQLLESAAAARLPVAEGVREMRAIAGMTQEEFARHREVSARVIKEIERGQGNPTLATLNRIGQFFGLEVAFVPIRRGTASEQSRFTGEPVSAENKEAVVVFEEYFRQTAELQKQAAAQMLALTEALARMAPGLHHPPAAQSAAEDGVDAAAKPRPRPNTRQRPR